MGLCGVQATLDDATKSISTTEINSDINSEKHGGSEDMWTTLPVAMGNCRLDANTQGGIHSTDGETEHLRKEFEKYLNDISVDVAQGTDASYRRYMNHFDSWLQKKRLLPERKSIFADDSELPKTTPMWIVAWIMSQCDVVEPDGSPKHPNIVVSNPSTYTHAMKLRSSLTYGFGRNHLRSKRNWTLNRETGEWCGNPSVSVQVARYMVALSKRKKNAAGDRSSYAVGSRALTKEVLQNMYVFNQAEGRSEIQLFAPRIKKDGDLWGSPRRRLLVHAVITVAFVCLLRIDEALTLRFEDILYHSSEKIEVTLSSRKTHAFGGSKPYTLYMFEPEDEAICPIRALSQWILACGNENCQGYIFRAPGSNGQAPSPSQDVPISSAAFLELFRNNLIDIGLDADLYGGQSCRRGGCQWLVREKRWSIPTVCDWSSDFSHSSILRDLFSWNDDPYESREDYLNPKRKPMVVCHACGRSCRCCGPTIGSLL